MVASICIRASDFFIPLGTWFCRMIDGISAIPIGKIRFNSFHFSTLYMAKGKTFKFSNGHLNKDICNRYL